MADPPIVDTGPIDPVPIDDHPVTIDAVQDADAPATRQTRLDAPSRDVPGLDVVVGAGGRLAAEAARFAGMGWMRATSGNVSEVISSDPLRLVITASAIDKGEMTDTDVVVVDDRGHPIDVPGLVPRRPSAEAGLHARIASLTGSGAVVHVHALAPVVAAARWPAGVDLRDIEMLKGIGRPAHDEVITVPVVSNSQDMAALGDRVAAVLDPDVPGVLVAEHGLYAWGDSLRQARHHTECFEWLLSYALAVDGIGP